MKKLPVAIAVVAAILLVIVVILLSRGKRSRATQGQKAPGDSSAPGVGEPARATAMRGRPVDGGATTGAATPSEHGTGMDRRMAQVLAFLKAPEGKTPCETYWNAMQTEQESAKAAGKRSLFTRVAEKSEFFRICETLTPEQQKCVQPRYHAEHREDCVKQRPPQATLDLLFEVRGDLVDPEDLEHSVPGGAVDSGIPGATPTP